MITDRELGKTRLPLWAAGFVMLTCVAILGLSAWREWETRNADLRNAEIDVANLAHSLVQHADDTFELADTILVGLVHRLELDGTGPDTIAKLQAYLPTRKSSDRIRGIFVYDDDRPMACHDRASRLLQAQQQRPRIFPAPPRLARRRTR